MKKVLLAIVLLSLAGGLVFSLPPAMEADRLLLEAKKSMDAGNYTQAAVSFEKILDLDVQVPDMFYFHYGKALGVCRSSTPSKFNLF